MAWARERLGARDLERLTARAQNYADWLEQYFRREHVIGDVLGQDNRLVYQLCAPVLVIADTSCRVFDLLCVSAAARLAGSDLQLSMSPKGAGPLAAPELEALAAGCGFSAWLESPDELAERLQSAAPERIRWLAQPQHEPAEVVLRAAAKLGCHVSTRPVLGHGRYELLFYHREQTISVDYHRYGHLGWQSVGMKPSALIRPLSK
jgi:RHH-type proline utilization regulon transcriptional repressor/proline dehydrogenase/delta 1-pyrroline-5-carboxylate dehydrogenase